LNRATFDRAIAGLEASKREDFSKQTLETWFSIMTSRGWTNGLFLEKTRGVLDSKQYGGVKFDSFIEGKGFYTIYEANQIARNLIDKRKVQLEELKTPIEEIEQEGLIEIQEVYNRRIRVEQDKQRANQEKKVKEVEKFIRCASDGTKIKIFEILKKKKLLDDKEKFWREILHLFAPQLMNEVQEMMKS
jgi:hypothetical protein